MSKTGRVSETGSRARRIAALPCGRRTKYLVVVFWIVVIALTGSLAGKLQGAEKNDASSYLPASADSTQELNLQARFTSKNLNPAVLIYQRQSGITRADLNKAAADARQFAAIPVVAGRWQARSRARPPGDRDHCRLGPRLHRQHRGIRQRPEGDRVRRQSRGIGLRHRACR